MKTIKAKCLYYGGDARDNGYGPQVSATFLPEGLADTKENRIYVNCKESMTEKVKKLRGLKKDGIYELAEAGTSQAGKPYYDILEGSLQENGAAENGSTQQPQTQSHSSHVISYELLRDCYFQVVRDVDRFCSEELENGEERNFWTAEERQAMSATIFIAMQKERAFPRPKSPSEMTSEEKYNATIAWLKEDRAVKALIAGYKKVCDEELFDDEQKKALANTIISKFVEMEEDEHSQEFRSLVHASRIQPSASLADKLWPRVDPVSGEETPF